jgi:hypothetical protein
VAQGIDPEFKLQYRKKKKKKKERKKEKKVACSCPDHGSI